MSISVILTCRNEEKIIEESIKRIYKYLKENFDKFEVLILDDNSTDKTPDILRKISKRYPDVKVYLSKKRIGKGWSLLYLIRQSKYEKIVYIDIDLPTDLKNIKKVYNLLDKYDIVVGIRRKRENIIRAILSRIYNFIANLFLFLDICDIQTGFKGFRKSKVKDILTLENHWNWDTEFLLKAKEKRLKIGKIMINWYNIRKSRLTVLATFYMFRRLLSIVIRYYFGFFRIKVIRDYINEKTGIFIFKISSFFLTIALARLLGPSGYGIYTIALSIAFLISSFSDLGVPIAILRYLGKEKEKQSVYFRFFLKILILANIVILIIFTLFSKDISNYFLKDPSLSPFIIASALIAFTIVCYNSLKSVFILNKRFETIRNLSIIEGWLKFFLIVLLVLALGTFGSILGFLLAYVTVLFYTLFLLRKYYPHLFEKVKGEIKKASTIKYLLFVNLTTAARSLYGWVDSLIIALLVNPIGVSYYRITNALISTINLLTGLQTVLAPRILQWDIKTIKRNLPKIFLAHLLISLLAFVILNVLAKYLIIIVYGLEYLPALNLLRVGSLLIILNSFGYFSLIFDLKGKPQYNSIILSVTTIVNALLDYILILKIGLIGAMWATVFAWITSLLAGAIIFYKKFRD